MEPQPYNYRAELVPDWMRVDEAAPTVERWAHSGGTALGGMGRELDQPPPQYHQAATSLVSDESAKEAAFLAGMRAGESTSSGYGPVEPMADPQYPAPPAESESAGTYVLRESSGRVFPAKASVIGPGDIILPQRAVDEMGLFARQPDYEQRRIAEAQMRMADRARTGAAALGGVGQRLEQPVPMYQQASGALSGVVSDREAKEQARLAGRVEGLVAGLRQDDARTMTALRGDERDAMFGDRRDQMFVDPRMERGLSAAPPRTPEDETLESMTGYTYNYKPEYQQALGLPGDRRYGVMAQDLEQTPLGSTLVNDTPAGKVIDGQAATGASLAMMGRLAERDKEREGRSALRDEMLARRLERGGL
jgi:hypothetical protein